MLYAQLQLDVSIFLQRVEGHVPQCSVAGDGTGVYVLAVGWSWQCLEDWSTFSLVVMPSVVMTFIFWLSTEIGTFLSGRLKLSFLDCQAAFDE